MYGRDFNGLQIDELDINVGAEGAATSLSLEFENSDRAHTVTVDWGDGHIDNAPLSSNQNSLAIGHIYAEDGDYSVKVRIADTDNPARVVEETRAISVANVAPTVLVFNNPHSVQEGSLLSLHLTISDPGFANPMNPADLTIETFTYQVDWRDGSPIESGPIAISQLGGPGIPTGKQLAEYTRLCRWAQFVVFKPERTRDGRHC